MTTTRTYDYLNRLTSISSQPSASGLAPIAYSYSYNDANQRTRVNMADGSFWIYEYDKLGQVISGKRYWSDWTPVAGQQYEYAFDDIGNRSSTKSGGDANGADLRTSLFSANALNQYTSHYVPPYLNVLGIAHANASVTVNSQSPYRRGEYFWKELSVDNSSAAVWQSITNIASLTGMNQTNTGNLFLTKSPEDPLLFYDADGNLTSDGRWTNRWDAENRLIDMTSHSSGPSGSRKSLQFAYDSQGRRYSKVVSNWTGSAWTRALHELYLYDGWNLLGALDGTNNAIIRSFLWGLDLSGSLQGAGGVGGLICFKQHSGSLAGSHFAAYDGNGNVMALVDGKTGSTSSRYEYDPFGQTIRASGPMAALNAVRFSSKPVDDETDLAYYGYRYLNPNTGRWLNRDPIGERGGLHLYQFVHGNPGNRIDPDGKETFTCGGEVSLLKQFRYDKIEGDCDVVILIFPYAYRCFREGKFRSNDLDDFYTEIQIRTRKTRRCACWTSEDTTYHYCSIPGPPGVLIKPDLEDFTDTFPKPSSSDDFNNRFCSGAAAAFGN